MIYEKNLETNLEKNLKKFNRGNKSKLLHITLITQTQELCHKLTHQWNEISNNEAKPQ